MGRASVSVLAAATLVALFLAGCGGDQAALVEPSTGTESGVSGDLASAAALSVVFDIKPGSCPNAFNPVSKGVLPVAILGTPDLDVTEIDVSTLLLEGAIAPLRSHIADVATAPVPEPQLPNIEVVTFYGPRTAVLGGVVGRSIRLTIRNSESVAAYGSFSVGYYISADPVITTSDRLLIGGREHVSGLLGGQQKVVTLFYGASVPTDAPTGDVFLGVIVDEFNLIAESDETDNARAWPITISPSGETVVAPDLMVEDENCACTTDGPDGIDDLTLKFRTQELVESLGAMAPGETRELTISGVMLDGTPFTGVDCIVVVGGGSGDKDDPSWSN